MQLDQERKGQLEKLTTKCNNFVADCGLVFNLLKCHRHVEFISPWSEAFTTDHLYFKKYCLRIVAIMLLSIYLSELREIFTVRANGQILLRCKWDTRSKRKN